MSLRQALNRVVSIIPMNVESVDAYHDRHRGPGAEIPNVPTRRDQLQATEDTNDRDQQARTFVYLFLPDVAISGRDRIRDGDDVLEVIGEPDVVSRRRRPHHIEATARIVSG